MLTLICFSINNWEKRKARKQQFMLSLAKRQDVAKVVYVEPALNLWRLIFSPGEELKDKGNQRRWLRALRFSYELAPEVQKLIILTPIFFLPFAFRLPFIYQLNLYLWLKFIRRKLKGLGFKEVILWLYNPYDFKLLSWFRQRCLAIFDWAEDWPDYFRDYPKRLKDFLSKAQLKCIKEADIVFTVSEYLLKQAKVINPNTWLLRDGTNWEYFVKPKLYYTPADLKDIPHPILGYVGTVSFRFDAALVLALSQRLVYASIVIIGKILTLTPEIRLLQERKNVYFLGEKDYSELGGYLNNFDVCILPYLTEVKTPAPTKIYDYLASGKPIVSTSILELGFLSDYIWMARNYDEFTGFCVQALKENNAVKQRLRIEKAQENSWDKRADEIMEFVRNLLVKKGIEAKI